MTTTRETPILKAPPEPEKKAKVSKADAIKWLTARGRPQTNKQFKKAREAIRKKREKKALPKGRDVSISQADAPKQIIYGQVMCGGIINLVNVLGTTSHWLNYIITIAAHEIEQIVGLYVDGNLVTLDYSLNSKEVRAWANQWVKPDGTTVSLGGDRIFLGAKLGATSQVAQPDAVGVMNASGIWTSDHRGRGIAHCYMAFVWDANHFDGTPEVEFKVKGKKVRDPRLALVSGNYQRVFSSNPALILLDFLTDAEFGMGVALADIDITTFNDSADLCDEAVTLKSTATEARYSCDFYFESGEDKQQIVEEILATMNGRLFWSQGVIKLKAGAWTEPVMTLTMDDVRSENISFKEYLDQEDVFNSIRGKYVSKEQIYKVSDYGAFSPTAFVTEDAGVVVWKDEDYPYVTSGTQAQRVALQSLKSNRYQRQLSCSFSSKAYPLEPGDNVLITMPMINLSEIPFEVEDIYYEQGQGGEITCSIQLRETNEAVFDYNAAVDELDINIPENLVLPDPRTVVAPSSLFLGSGTDYLYRRADGTIFSRLFVSWDETEDGFVYGGGKVLLQIKRSASSTWGGDQILEGISSNTYFLEVQEGVNYDVRVKFINSIGFSSDWSTASNHTVLGKLEAPSDVEGFSATKTDFGIVFNWQEISDLDRSEYEIRLGSNWDNGEYVWKGKGSTAKWENKSAGTYIFQIKSYDTSGNASSNTASYQLVIAGPQTPVLSATFSGPNIIFSWTAVAADFAIKEYELRRGSSYSSGATIAVITGKSFVLRADYGGAETFWVVARDISGNQSSPGSKVVTVNNPNPVVDFLITTIGNNVKLDWYNPDPSSLPIDKYIVYKGDTFASSVLIGESAGTFHTYIERVGGTYTYHVEAVDTAGNVGTHASYTATITVSEDYYIKSDIDLIAQDSAVISEVLVTSVRVRKDPDADLSEIYLPIDNENTGDVVTLPLPINAMESKEQTWDEWFSANGWETWQDIIDDNPDGPLRLPTSLNAGYIEWTVDHGVIFGASFIDFLYDLEILGEGINITPSIQVSEDDITYTAFLGAQQLFSSDFRYSKHRLSFKALSNRSLAKLRAASIRISLRTGYEIQELDCDAEDIEGTQINFVKNYADVQQITVTVLGTDAAMAVVDFLDEPNQTYAKILLFDKDGNRASRRCQIKIEGATVG